MRVSGDWLRSCRNCLSLPRPNIGPLPGLKGSLTTSTRKNKGTALDINDDKPGFEVTPGETFKFVVTNTGKLRHEFMIGDTEEQRQHAEMMKQMPDMVHEDANTLTVEPGETTSLFWHFIRTGKLEVASHIPGHHQAGMRSAVIVAR